MAETSSAPKPAQAAPPQTLYDELRSGSYGVYSFRGDDEATAADNHRFFVSKLLPAARGFALVTGGTFPYHLLLCLYCNHGWPAMEGRTRFYRHGNIWVAADELYVSIVDTRTRSPTDFQGRPNQVGPSPDRASTDHPIAYGLPR
jgi:hypothetical protein